MTRTNGRSAHCAWALAAALALAASLVVAFLTLSSASADPPTATRGSSGLRYALIPTSGAPSASVSAALAVNIGPTPHGPTYSPVADECATCHRTHTGKSKNLLKAASPQSTLCFTCHDGSGALANVQVQYTAAGGPENVPANREYYRHEATVASSHTSSLAEVEFKGTLNRHSECSDCHNPHKADSTNSAATPTPPTTTPSTGWTASGRLSGVSGVSVNLAVAVTAPTYYKFLDGKTDLVTHEYQLCFKCHSGFTALPGNAGFTPSKHLLDKGVEFDPRNPSFHPIEAMGTNQTAAMAASLAGGNVWKFLTTDTIRCSNCHASPAKLTPTPAKGADLPPHTSPNRGILLQKYEDRALRTTPFDTNDFALCFMCHASSPFSSEAGDNTRTNFRYHGKHTAALGDGNGAAIDTPGAGQGNAICAECHFRLHGATKDMGGNQTIPGSRLVNFSPNITGSGGVRSWSQTGRSCTLTCHGENHTGWNY